MTDFTIKSADNINNKHDDLHTIQMLQKDIRRVFVEPSFRWFAI